MSHQSQSKIIGELSDKMKKSHYRPKEKITLIDDLANLGLEGVRKNYYMHNARGYQVIGADYQMVNRNCEVFLSVRYFGETGPTVKRRLEELAIDSRTQKEKIKPSFNAWKAI